MPALIALKDLDNEVILFEFNKETGLLSLIDKVLNEFEIYGVFERAEFNYKITDEIYDKLKKYEYHKNEPADIHLIKFDNSIIMIFYLKKIKREDLIKKIKQHFQFQKKTQ